MIKKADMWWPLVSNNFIYVRLSICLCVDIPNPHLQRSTCIMLYLDQFSLLKALKYAPPWNMRCRSPQTWHLESRGERHRIKWCVAYCWAAGRCHPFFQGGNSTVLPPLWGVVPSSSHWLMGSDIDVVRGYPQNCIQYSAIDISNVQNMQQYGEKDKVDQQYFCYCAIISVFRSPLLL